MNGWAKMLKRFAKTFGTEGKSSGKGQLYRVTITIGGVCFLWFNVIARWLQKRGPVISYALHLRCVRMNPI